MCVNVMLCVLCAVVLRVLSVSVCVCVRVLCCMCVRVMLLANKQRIDTANHNSFQTKPQ